ncbi:MAG: ABC transporter permease [Flavobacteriaceae bacterium]|nr:MAG: ABC transporter permease [Flavobacteriaceae bacterium]
MSVKNQEKISQEPIGKREYLWMAIPILIIVAMMVFLVVKYQSEFTLENIQKGLDINFAIFFAIGVFAQLVDGTLGMGYGATSTSFLMAYGVPPKLSSMAIHVAEMFTTGASAISHYKFQNISKNLFLKLILPGIIGSAIGAYLLSEIVDGEKIKPFISLYLIVLAIMIVIKGLRKTPEKKENHNLTALATFGGFMDAVGGGGWGPIVTSNLVGKGRNPRYVIGSVNAAEFGVALASGITFLLFDGLKGWKIILGLILGGHLQTQQVHQPRRWIFFFDSNKYFDCGKKHRRC